jgi:hypothetical protein
MTIAPYRAKQTTTTTGTGTVTLIAAASNVRSLNAAIGGSSVPTHYVLSGATYYEIGIGVFDGGSPGTLTRATVLASSNAGSLVSLPAGTTDVFIPAMPGLWGIRTGTGSDSPGTALLGETYVWTGSSAGTLSLPAAASCPPYVSAWVVNQGTAILTIDPNASETINGVATIALYPGQSVEIYRRGSNWDAPGHTTVPPIFKSGSGTMSAGILAVTFATPFPNAIVDASAEQFGATAVGTFNGVALSTLAVNTFTAYSVVGYSGSIRWRAWGY